jgi:hypothetical protein
MKICTCYKAKIKETEYSSCFSEAVEMYRKAVAFYISVAMEMWDDLLPLSSLHRKSLLKAVSVQTKDNPAPKYNFTDYMYKFPCYYRRSAIAEAVGKVSSYKSNLENWEKTHDGARHLCPSWVSVV